MHSKVEVNRVLLLCLHFQIYIESIWERPNFYWAVVSQIPLRIELMEWTSAFPGQEHVKGVKAVNHFAQTPQSEDYSLEER